MPVTRKRTGSTSQERAHRTRVAVEAATFLVEAGAKQRARVDTGQMRAGLQGQITGEYEGRVRGHAPWTIFNELGTRHMPAQPMLVPAAEEVRGPFLRALKQAWS